MEQEFKCECGRIFKTAASRNSHYRFCNVHVPIKKYDENGKCISKSKYKIDENLYRCECGKEFNNHQSLNAHFSHCDYHHNCLGTKRKGHTSELTHSMCWDNKSDEEVQLIRRKSGKTYSDKIKKGIIKPSFLDRQHSEETKNKIRFSTVKYLETRFEGSIARYNKKSIGYINRLNEEKGWNLQHAENGGEVEVCGYFLDGYDKELNIAFEYDEPRHYKDVYENVLIDRDMKRQNFIIENLKCRFFRYNEKMDLLYEVQK